jgi:hypothetical protein
VGVEGWGHGLWLSSCLVQTLVSPKKKKKNVYVDIIGKMKAFSPCVLILFDM